MWVIARLSTLQLPTSSTSRRGGYGCGFDLCSDSIRIDEVKAFKRLSTKGGDLEESTQAIDLIGKDVGNRKSSGTTRRASRTRAISTPPRPAAGTRCARATTIRGRPRPTSRTGAGSGGRGDGGAAPPSRSGAAAPTRCGSSGSHELGG